MQIESVDFILASSIPSKLTLTFTLQENIDYKLIHDIAQNKIIDLIKLFGYQIQPVDIEINSLVDLTDEGDTHYSYVCISEVCTN